MKLNVANGTIDHQPKSLRDLFLALREFLLQVTIS
jgi:hypothetical protein